MRNLLSIIGILFFGFSSFSQTQPFDVLITTKTASATQKIIIN